MGCIYIYIWVIDGIYIHIHIYIYTYIQVRLSGHPGHRAQEHDGCLLSAACAQGSCRNLCTLEDKTPKQHLEILTRDGARAPTSGDQAVSH